MAVKLMWTMVLQLSTIACRWQKSILGVSVCVCVYSHTLSMHFFFFLISQGFTCHFSLLPLFFLPHSLLFFSLCSGFQECIECPYLCPCKHKGEPAAEVEFLCRSQADRPHHTLASGQPRAKMALYSYFKNSLKRH